MKNNQDAFKIKILNESLLNLSEISRVINGCFVRRSLNNRSCLVKTMLLMTIFAYSDKLILFYPIIELSMGGNWAVGFVAFRSPGRTDDLSQRPVWCLKNAFSDSFSDGVVKDILTTNWRRGWSKRTQEPHMHWSALAWTQSPSDLDF